MNATASVRKPFGKNSLKLSEFFPARNSLLILLAQNRSFLLTTPEETRKKPRELNSIAYGLPERRALGAMHPGIAEFKVMELLSVREVAAHLKISSRQIWKLLSSGRIPEPVRISRSVRWRKSDIDLWVQLGCPSRERFEAEALAGSGGAGR